MLLLVYPMMANLPFVHVSCPSIEADPDRAPAITGAHKAPAMDAEETKSFMKQLAQYVFDHHMKKTQGSVLATAALVSPRTNCQTQETMRTYQRRIAVALASGRQTRQGSLHAAATRSCCDQEKPSPPRMPLVTQQDLVERWRWIHFSKSLGAEF
jgi:hypothetical protein